MTDKITLGIDTSNYTTSAAIVINGEVVYNGKAPLPVSEGERGLRQSDAVFAHIKNLPHLMETVKEKLGGRTPDAIGVSYAPRDTENSYMPCFLSGRAAAYAASAVSGALIYEFSHQAGHITAALYSAGKTELIFGVEPFFAFHVSGGTTDIALVTPCDGRLDIETVGGTLDLNAGQLIDRVGVYMGMKFPSGAELEREAALFDGKTKGIKTSVDGLFCNLSGAENRAKQLYDKTKSIPEVSAFTLDFVTETLDKLSGNLREKYGSFPIIYAGGVMSCRRMRGKLGRRENVYFSEPQYSADNAAGTALLTYYKHTK